MSYQIAELLDGVSVWENRNRSNQNFQNLLALINEHGFVWNGDYIDSFEYIKWDVVKYNHSLYIAKVPTISLIPTNTSAWDLLVESYQGETGPVGPQGTGITSIVRTSGSGTPWTFDTYTITFSNATTTTFQVWNGSNGTGNMNKSENLSWLVDYIAARTNLSVYSKAEVDWLTHGATNNSAPVDADEFSLYNSTTSFSLNRLTWANIKATLKTYFDSIYQAALWYTAANASNVVDLSTTQTIWGIKSFSKLVSSAMDNTTNGAWIKANGTDHVYYEWLVNLVRKAYIGFPWAGLTTFTITNEQVNWDINLVTNGTWVVKINWVSVPLTGGVDVLSVRSFF